MTHSKQPVIGIWLFIFSVVLLITGCSSTSTTPVSRPVSPVRNPTSPPRPTSPPANPVSQGAGNFSMATANTNRPSSVRQEVDIFAGGGYGPICESGSRASVDIWPGERVELLPLSRTDTSAGDITIFTCGWASTGSLPVIVTYPDGSTRNRTAQVTRSYDGGLEAHLDLDLGRNPQLGSYQVKFDGRSRDMYANIRIIAPTGPRLYTLSNGDVALWNFRANEPVTLYAYQTTGPYHDKAKFIAYQEYLTDANGSLYVDVNLSAADTFVAVGARTGQVIDFTPLKPMVVSRVQQ